MTNNKVIDSIKHQLNKTKRISNSKEYVLARINKNPNHLIPKRAEGNQEKIVVNFIHQARLAGTDVIKCTKCNVAEKINRWLLDCTVEKLNCSADNIVKDLFSSKETHAKLTFGESNINDQASLTSALVGIAETGTLMLYSSVKSPTLNAFLPDYHLVLLSTRNIVGSYEKAWVKLKKLFPKTLPRNVNLITGPSRSADIEQTLLMGAHGPKELILFLINDD